MSIQNWEICCRWGEKGFFFSFLVRMVLELIELNYREGIWGLAIAKCRR